MVLTFSIITCALVFNLAERLPMTYLLDTGQTAFKIQAEVILVIINLVTAALLYRQILRSESINADSDLKIKRTLLIFACVMMAFPKLTFLCTGFQMSYL